MALLGTYINAGAACLAATGINCFLHGLPTTPDWVTAGAFGITNATAVCIPYMGTRGGTTTQVNNLGPATAAEQQSVNAHAIIR